MKAESAGRPGPGRQSGPMPKAPNIWDRFPMNGKKGYSVMARIHKRSGIWHVYYRQDKGEIKREQRLGGIISWYYREAA